MPPGKTFFLFDLDGTLLSLGWDAPEVSIRRARVREIVRELGINPPFGMMVPALAEIGRHKPWVAQALDELELAAAEQARECGGALGLLAALSGLPLALVTSNGRACIERAMAVVGLPRSAFGAIVCRDDVTCFKPDPESLHKAVAGLQALHGQPARVVMVGDSATDVQAARALGMGLPCTVLAYGVLHGVSKKEALVDAGADAVAARTCDLLDRLRGEAEAWPSPAT